MGDKLLSKEDLFALKGSADEPNWDIFIRSIGGSKISDLHPNPSFENADYIFPNQGVILELKVLETEFGSTDQFREKARIHSERSLKKWRKSPLSLDATVSADYLKGFVELFRPPLARIAKKANRQIRSTKQNLNVQDYRGIWLLVNDGFRELPPRLMLATLGRILNGSCGSVDAVIYLTNHCVIMPEDEFGRFLWTPLYSPNAPDGLVDFVDWLGRGWFDYEEKLTGPFDDRQEGDDLSIVGSRAAGSRFPIS